MRRCAQGIGLAFLLMAGLSAAAAAVCAQTPINSDGVAVIVGNRSYKGSIPAVEYAHRDAEAMKRYVIDMLGFREGNIIDLRDATQAEIFAVFGSRESERGRLWGYSRAGRSDVVVFYSGHGVPGLRDRRAYLLPVDADPNSPEINGYPLDLLYENLVKLGARSVTVFLDACFSGDSDKGMLIRATSGIGIEARLPRAATGLAVLTAAQGDQVASWDEAARHGLFTRHLLDALYGKADLAPHGNGDGRVTLAEAKAFLDEEMSYAARRQYRRVQQASSLGDAARVLAAFPPGKPPARPSPPSPVQPAVGVFPPPPNLRPGQVFKDCPECPEMVVVPAGEFTMGSPPEERRWVVSQGAKEEWVAWETPQHRVTLPRPIAAGKFEVTRAEYAAFARDAGHGAGDGCYAFKDGKWEKDAGKSWRDPGFQQTDRDPVACVSWADAKAYVEWLSRKTGKPYRMLSEAEWEYAARAGTTTRYGWGDDRDNEQGCGYANGADRTRARPHTLAETKDNIFMCEDGYVFTAPVGLYRANGFGLHDMLGNVWEWTEDCWHDSYAGAPADGSAWLTGGNCGIRVLRGGSWVGSPRDLRSALRDGNDPGNRINLNGFRVARTLN